MTKKPAKTAAKKPAPKKAAKTAAKKPAKKAPSRSAAPKAAAPKGAPIRVLDYMTGCPHSIGADQPLAEAHEMMRSLKVRHLPVLSGGKLLGILSDRDLAFVESMKDVDPKRITVEEAMTPEPYVCEGGTSLATVAREMQQHRYGAALVTEGGKLIGVFTTTDALRALGDALEGRVPA